MCGFVGYVAHKNQNTSERLKASLQSIAHRGPDDEGVEVFDLDNYELCVAHKRLSIIDLSANGHQPFIDLTGQFVIIYNGEVYNYRELRDELICLGHTFKTDSDTEVVLESWKAWGSDSWKKFIGMFSLVIYDKQNQELILVRDAFGIKPLYYSFDKGNLYFASEPKALITMLGKAPELNLQRSSDYLAYGLYDNNEQTFFEGIYQLMPAHYLKFDLNSASIGSPKRWWLPNIQERKDLSFEQAAVKLRELFLNNIRLHMRSDVPLGAALSGGLDSSAVVSAMRAISPDSELHTFTYVALGSDKNEEVWADQVVAHTKAKAHKIYVAPSELITDLDDMITRLGEPFGSTSIYAQYRVFKAARDAGIIVTLDGQGADELLAGYHGYPVSYLQSLLEKKQWIKAVRFIRAWTNWPGRNFSDAKAIIISAVTPDWVKNAIDIFFKNGPLPNWLNKDYLIKSGVCITPPRATFKTKAGKKRRLVEQLRSALLGSGLAQLLRHGDRTSMRWSLESRVPFLTTELAEFLLSLPEEYLLSNDGQTKSVFREAMRGIVPNEILDRRDKIGFETPEYGWLREQMPLIRQWILEGPELPFLNKKIALAEVESMMSGDTPYNRSAWRIINYCRWSSLIYSDQSLMQNN
jgi:asparagine synthase (glutamine-hydrolysing)